MPIYSKSCLVSIILNCADIEAKARYRILNQPKKHYKRLKYMTVRELKQKIEARYNKLKLRIEAKNLLTNRFFLFAKNNCEYLRFN